MRTASGLNVTEWGDGEPAVFIHGSFGWGEMTFSEQKPLAEHYRLLLVDRRGFGKSAANGRVDFDRDADDVAELLAEGAHLVGHSYGGVVSLLAAARRPEAVRSLTVIEPPAFGVARGEPAVEDLVRRIDAAARATDDPAEYRMLFLQGFGFPAQPEQLEGLHLVAAESSMRERPPWEAEIPLERLAAARFPVMLVKGDWCPAPDTARARAGAAFARVCEVLENGLGAEVATFPAAHSPHRLGQIFNDRLRAFWEAP